MTKAPPGSKWAAALRKQAICSACVVRFIIVLNTKYTRENESSSWVVEKSPSVTRISAAPGFATSLFSIGCDKSIPWTGNPLLANGSAIRPVPIPNSSTLPAVAQVKLLNVLAPVICDVPEPLKVAVPALAVNVPALVQSPGRIMSEPVLTIVDAPIIKSSPSVRAELS